jgi:hypothetical protein
MFNSHSRRAVRLRDSGLALAPETRDRLRECTITEGVERVARRLGVSERALLSVVAGVPARSTPGVLAALSERGLP